MRSIAATVSGFPQGRAGTGAGEALWIRLAGWAGIATVVLDLVAIGFYMVAGQPPDYADASKYTAYVHNGGMVLIAAALVFSVSFTVGMAFITGIRDLIAAAGGLWRSVGNLFLLANGVAYAVGLVGVGLLIASATEATTKADPAVTRALMGGGFSILGAVNYTELVLAVAVYAYYDGRTGFLPRWTGWLGWIAVLGGAACIPAAFGGTGFYSQLGAAPLTIGFIPLLVWSLSVAVCMTGARPRSAHRRGADPQRGEGWHPSRTRGLAMAGHYRLCLLSPAEGRHGPVRA